MDGTDGTDGSDGGAVANASVDALPRQGQGPLGRAIQSATEKKNVFLIQTLCLFEVAICLF